MAKVVNLSLGKGRAAVALPKAVCTLIGLACAWYVRDVHMVRIVNGEIVQGTR